MSTAKCAGRGPRRKRGRERPGGGGHGRAGGDQPVLLYGHHACLAALANPRREIRSVHATANAAERVAEPLAKRGIEPEIEEPQRLARRLGPDAVHQGIIVEARPLSPVALADVAPGSPLVAVDQVSDPRNLGAILRVAAAFGAAGLITTRRHTPAESGLIAKAASGGLEHVPMIEVANLTRALGQAREAGYWIAGLDGGAEPPFDDIAGEQPLALVLGSEGRGLRRLTREACHGLYRIVLPGPVTSLNVATAAAVVLQSVARARA